MEVNLIIITGVMIKTQQNPYRFIFIKWIKKPVGNRILVEFLYVCVKRGYWFYGWFSSTKNYENICKFKSYATDFSVN